MASLTYALLLAAALSLVLWLAFRPALALRRARRLRGQPVPAYWRDILRADIWFYDALDPDTVRRLHEQMHVFLDQRNFVGCNGLRVTERMRVTIAAYACLLRLDAPSDPYPGLRSILVYPGPFLVEREHEDEAGVVTMHTDTLTGESWEEGRVILSWADVEDSIADPAAAGNVIVHEFSHQLDQLDGAVSGAPPLHSPDDYERWADVMASEYEHLVERRHGGDHVLDDYGATAPEEFFAVAVEAFFTRPLELARRHRALYATLEAYFGLTLAACEEAVLQRGSP